MIKFFRKIRQNMFETGKTTKYFKYAIGEIALVVIGILIALQINNWNESRKQSLSMKQALSSLIADLKQDSILLSDNLDDIKKDMTRLADFKNRLSKNTATIDTVRKIARYEYLPFFNPSNEVNRNTILSLLSTGRLEFFDDNIKNEILKHNSKQLSLVKVMDENVKIFLSVMASGITLPSENKAFDIAIIRGPLLDDHWNNLDDKKLLEIFTTNLGHKIMMQFILKDTKNELYEATLQMINTLQTYQATL